MEKAMVKNWLSEHVAEVIYGVLIAIGNFAGLARLKSNHGKRLDKVEGDLEKHTESGELHRYRDFERRLDTITSDLKKIKVMLNQFLQQMRYPFVFHWRLRSFSAPSKRRPKTKR